MYTLASLRSIGLAAAILLSAHAAHANVFEIDYTTVAGGTADLAVTTFDAPVGGPFSIISITGTRAGDMITGLSAYASSDNLVSPTSPYFDFSGVSYTTAHSGDFNLFTQNGGIYELSSITDPGGYPNNDPALSSVDVTDVPEPASLAMLGVGLFGLGTICRARRT